MQRKEIKLGQRAATYTLFWLVSFWLTANQIACFEVHAVKQVRQFVDESGKFLCSPERRFCFLTPRNNLQRRKNFPQN